ASSFLCSGPGFGKEPGACAKAIVAMKRHVAVIAVLDRFIGRSSKMKSNAFGSVNCLREKMRHCLHGSCRGQENSTLPLHRMHVAMWKTTLTRRFAPSEAKAFPLPPGEVGPKGRVRVQSLSQR